MRASFSRQKVTENTQSCLTLSDSSAEVDRGFVRARVCVCASFYVKSGSLSV